MAGERVLLAEDDPLSREFLTRALELLDLDVTAVDDGDAASRVLAREPFEFVFTDLRMPGRDGMAVLAESKRLDADRPVILVTAHGTVDVAVAAVKRGADDVLEKPVTVDQLELAVLRARERRRILGENRRLRSENDGAEELLVLSPAMRALVAAVGRIAPSRATVLLRGESGTGKERVAALVHRLSDRSRGPYVKVNCAAIPTRAPRERVLRPREGRLHRARTRAARAGSNRPTGGRCCSTRSARSRRRSRPSCCASCRKATSPASADHASCARTSASSRPPTASSRPRSPRGGSGWTSSTV